jgi:hypothetical protein
MFTEDSPSPVACDPRGCQPGVSSHSPAASGDRGTDAGLQADGQGAAQAQPQGTPRDSSSARSGPAACDTLAEHPETAEPSTDEETQLLTELLESGVAVRTSATPGARAGLLLGARWPPREGPRERVRRAAPADGATAVNLGGLQTTVDVHDTPRPHKRQRRRTTPALCTEPSHVSGFGPEKGDVEAVAYEQECEVQQVRACRFKDPVGNPRATPRARSCRAERSEGRASSTCGDRGALRSSPLQRVHLPLTDSWTVLKPVDLGCIPEGHKWGATVVRIEGGPADTRTPATADLCAATHLAHFVTALVATVRSASEAAAISALLACHLTPPLHPTPQRTPKQPGAAGTHSSRQNLAFAGQWQSPSQEHPPQQRVLAVLTLFCPLSRLLTLPPPDCCAAVRHVLLCLPAAQAHAALASVPRTEGSSGHTNEDPGPTSRASCDPELRPGMKPAARWADPKPLRSAKRPRAPISPLCNPCSHQLDEAPPATQHDVRSATDAAAILHSLLAACQDKAAAEWLRGTVLSCLRSWAALLPCRSFGDQSDLGVIALVRPASCLLCYVFWCVQLRRFSLVMLSSTMLPGCSM